MEATLNSILREWRDLWPGGLPREQYSRLNLMAQCRQGTLGYNRARCEVCQHVEWYASSCGDRHCPNCLGPRQARWSLQVCQRLPDCAHFHLVLTLPSQVWDFIELNYRTGCDIFFFAAAETIRLFQYNNQRIVAGFLAVLHTWGQLLNWHPHLHVLVSAGGMDADSGEWREQSPEYFFNVYAMSRVFRAIFIRRLEQLDGDRSINWPDGLDTMESRRTWRVDLAGRNWNIFSRPTLANTRAVVRYLARYTSRIAMSNSRITRVDPIERSVTFTWKDYRHGNRTKPRTMPGALFLRSFARHLVPKGFRRVRYFGLLAGKTCRTAQLPGAPQQTISENASCQPPPACPCCGAREWTYLPARVTHAITTDESLLAPVICRLDSSPYRFSLYLPRDRPKCRPTGAGDHPTTPAARLSTRKTRPTSG